MTSYPGRTALFTTSERLESELRCIESMKSFPDFPLLADTNVKVQPSPVSPKPTIGTAECRKSVRNCAGVGAASSIEPLAVNPPLGSGGAASAGFLAVVEEMRLTQPGRLEALPVGGSIKELPALCISGSAGGKQHDRLQQPNQEKVPAILRIAWCKQINRRRVSLLFSRRRNTQLPPTLNNLEL